VARLSSQPTKAKPLAMPVYGIGLLLVMEVLLVLPGVLGLLLLLVEVVLFSEGFRFALVRSENISFPVLKIEIF